MWRRRRFPVVDENDRVVETRHGQKCMGITCVIAPSHIFIFNDRGDVFLQKRSRWKDRHPLLWDSSAAGHVDAGEDYDIAAIRELRKSLGSRRELKRIVKLPASDQTGQEFIWLYRAAHEGPFQLAATEIDYGAFFPPALVAQWIAARPEEFAPGFVACWNEFNRSCAGNA